MKTIIDKKFPYWPIDKNFWTYSYETENNLINTNPNLTKKDNKNKNNKNVFDQLLWNELILLWSQRISHFCTLLLLKTNFYLLRWSRRNLKIFLDGKNVQHIHTNT